MRIKTPVPARIKRDIVGEAGPRECEVIRLMRGCYGSIDYMEQFYGFTPEYVSRVLRGVSEMVEYIADEYDLQLQEGDVMDVMNEYAERLDEAWDGLLDG